jgi:uncharacterized protein
MRCPVCKKTFDPNQTTSPPFCSERCRNIDLGRWLDEGYSLPHVPDPEDDEVAEVDEGSLGERTNGDAN